MNFEASPIVIRAAILGILAAASWMPGALLGGEGDNIPYKNMTEAFRDFFVKSGGWRKTQALRAVGSEFFAAVALGQVSKGGTLRALEELTDSHSWRDRAVSGAGPHSGWVRFSNTLWIPDGEILTAYGDELCRLFRIDTRVGKPASMPAGGSPGLFLLSQTEFMPRIPGGLFVERSRGDEDGCGGDGHLHTKILSVQFSEGMRGGWRALVPLEGDGELLVACGEEEDSKESEWKPWESRDVIVFFPQYSFQSSYQPEWIMKSGDITGASSDYGKLVQSGMVGLVGWTVEAQVKFAKHDSEDQAYPPNLSDGSSESRKIPAPTILRPDRSFRFLVKGPAGGVVFAGGMP